MIGEVFGESRWLWPLLWQSTVCLALGGLGEVSF
jgi:hypothetical protein